MNAKRDTVLIIEDDDAIRQSLRDILEDEGYDVVESANGQEALQSLRHGLSPCLILLDLMMPVMNGWEFRVEQMKEPVLAAIPVVVISADRSLSEKAYAISAASYLQKPIRLDKLLSVISQHCKGNCSSPA